MAEVRIGISGWTYPPWRKGAFYPAGLPQREELAHASRQVRSIEINGTFYSLQRPASFARWRAAVPGDFVFAVKAPRFITHLKRLRDSAAPLANFLASGVLELGGKLGPILWQLPPSLPYDRSRLEEFFGLLPRDTTAAAHLARTQGHPLAAPPEHRNLRHALEVRHASFQNPEFIALLRRHGVALVVADTAGKWPFMEDVTANFFYVRLHGDKELYASGYSPRALRTWAAKIRTWRRGGTPAGPHHQANPAPVRDRDVYVYFDNDVKVRAPYDAMRLAHLLGEGPPPPRPPPIASIAETPRTRWPAWKRRARQ